MLIRLTHGWPETGLDGRKYFIVAHILGKKPGFFGSLIGWVGDVLLVIVAEFLLFRTH
ncbi:hypothetical protein QUB78_26605 [Microcoleus sp. ARI1-A4]|uniref:hypothetical protein n=1 Tax=Microcoleus sp. ARI1-A1 TaxID=2818556 RepID=UPI002FCF8D29